MSGLREALLILVTAMLFCVVLLSPSASLAGDALISIEVKEPWRFANSDGGMSEVLPGNYFVEAVPGEQPRIALWNDIAVHYLAAAAAAASDRQDVYSPPMQGGARTQTEIPFQVSINFGDGNRFVAIADGRAERPNTSGLPQITVALPGGQLPAGTGVGDVLQGQVNIPVPESLAKALQIAKDVEQLKKAYFPFPADPAAQAAEQCGGACPADEATATRRQQ